MGINTNKIYLLIISTLLILFSYHSVIFAQTKSVTVSAQVVSNTNSFITVTPSKLEKGFYATAYIHIVDNNGNVVPGISVTVLSSNSEGINIRQPQSPTDANGVATASIQGLSSGVYYISAQYNTGGTTVNVPAVQLLITSLPVPVMNKEPLYTQGLSNEVSWQSLGNNYKYELEVSTDKEFSQDYVIKKDLSTTSYHLNNLQNSQVYFYRVRSINKAGIVSDWSDSVFSIQDNESPSILDFDFSPNDVSWVKAIDNGSIELIEILCQNEQGIYDKCGVGTNIGEDKFKINFISQEESFSINKVNYCIYAIDMAGNFSKKCPEHKKENVIIPPLEPLVTKPSSPNEKTSVKFSFLFLGLIFSILAWLLGIILYGLGGVWLLWISQRIKDILGWNKKLVSKGFVYDSSTKEPLFGVRVYFLDKNEKIIFRYITDINGEFKFPKLKSFNRIEVKSKNWTFPSRGIGNDKKDVYGNVYLGEAISSKKQTKFIIPVDESEEFIFRIKRFSLINRVAPLFKFLIKILTISSLIAFIYNFNNLSQIIKIIWLTLLAYDFVYTLFTITIKRYGYSYISAGFPELLSGVRVDLIDKADNIMFLRYTNKAGMFRFIVPKGDYEFRVWEHSGTKPSVKKEIKVKANLNVLKFLSYSVN